VSVQFAAGKGEMRVNNLAIEDYHFLANAIGPNFDNDSADDPAVVSFDVVWSPPITRNVSVPNGTLGNNYTGNYVENQVTVTWSGTNQATGFSFTSDPGSFATSFFDGGFAELGKEQNGIFLGSDSAKSAPASAAVAVTPAPLVLVPQAGIPAAPPVSAAPPVAGTPRSNTGTAQPLKIGAASDAAARMIALTGAAHAQTADYAFAELDGGFNTLWRE
jgi:hypothetical protein